MKRSLPLVIEKVSLPDDLIGVIGSHIDASHIKGMWCYANLCKYAATIAAHRLCLWIVKNKETLPSKISQMFPSPEMRMTIHQFLIHCSENPKLSKQSLSKMLLILYVILCGTESLYTKGGYYKLCRLDDCFMWDNHHRKIGDCYWYDSFHKRYYPMIEVGGLECNSFVTTEVDTILEKDVFNTYTIIDKNTYYSKDGLIPPKKKYPMASVVIDGIPLFSPHKKDFRYNLWIYDGLPGLFKTAANIHRNMGPIKSYLNMKSKWSGYG